jgi:predicted nucleic acid-binding protein
MGQRFIVDSNVIIDYTASLFSNSGNQFLENIFNNDFLISVAVKIEVLGFNDLPEKLLLIEEFVNTAFVISLDQDVTQKTIELRRNYKKLKLGDAIIAATALVHNLTLVTRNTKDFKRIDNLNIFDAHSI